MNIQRLEREIKNNVTQLVVALENRKVHPSFGYTKAYVLAVAHRLEGMTDAWLYITGKWDKPAGIVLTDDVIGLVEDKLGFNLKNLLKLAKES